MHTKRKILVETEIPTASMPDVVFMLLLFFMVTTVFSQFTGIPVELPKAQYTHKLEVKKNICHIHINSLGDIVIDDKEINIDSTYPLIAEKIRTNPKLLISIKMDRATPMKVLYKVQEELRKANALKVNYSAEFLNE